MSSSTAFEDLSDWELLDDEWADVSMNLTKPPNVTVIGNTTYCWDETLQSYSWCQTQQIYAVPLSKQELQYM